MGRSHVATGLAAGALLLVPALQTAVPAVLGRGGLVVDPVTAPIAQLAFVAICGGWALWPDLDHHSSTATAMWGPVTRVGHKVTAWAARGHRVGTHDPLIAPLAAAGFAYAASLHPWTAIVPIAITIGLVLRALEWLIPGPHEKTWWINLPASLAGGWAVVQFIPAGQLWWLPLAAAIGVAMAIGGDAVTSQGVVIPGSWISGKPRRTRGGPITTGGRLEVGVLVAAYATTAIGLYLAIEPLHQLLSPAISPAVAALAEVIR